MLERLYAGQVCSIARTLEVIGERWTILILREAFRGERRYDHLQQKLGVATNVLSARLQTLCDHGVLERSAYQERPQRFEYMLTDKGRDLLPVLVAMLQWGDRYAAEAGPPLLLRHRGCGGPVEAALTCRTCGREMERGEVEAVAGPGAAALPA